MHLGFASCIRLGVFTICACAALTAAIPSFCWDYIFRWLQTRERYAREERRGIYRKRVKGKVEGVVVLFFNLPINPFSFLFFSFIL